MQRLYQQVKAFNGRRGILLLATMFIAGAALIVLNFYTIKISDAIRAYVTGESLYSKGRKGASTDLMLYILEQDEAYYQSFKENIRLPLGDRAARIALMNGGELDAITTGFIDGGNHPEDIDEMIWLFNNFKNSTLMKRAIWTWEDADTQIVTMDSLAHQINSIVKQRALTPEERELFFAESLNISEAIALKQGRFADNLGEVSRRNTSRLLIGNTVIITGILAIAGYFIYMVFRVIDDSRRRLYSQNKKLVDSNQKLDGFVYASSHDLKSPINNLEGLIKIFEIQYRPENPNKLELLEKMKVSVTSLKTTIQDIEDLLKLDKMGHDKIVETKFSDLLGAILEENEMSFITSASEIETDFEVQSITYPYFALKSILYNLVSNAIKYQSPERKLSLQIATRREKDAIVLTVKDNGLGIDLDKHQSNLFRMFKRFHYQNTGSGLGLYSIKQVIEKNGGFIKVESEVNRGSTFTVSLPANFNKARKK